MDLEFVKDTELEIKLKKYLSSIKNFYGEEIAKAITLSNKSITVALRSSGLFDLDNVSDKDICTILLKNAILSSKVKFGFLKELTDEDKNTYFDDTLNLIETKKVYKKKLVENFIETSMISSESLLKNNKDKENALLYLSYLNSYIEAQKQSSKTK